MSAPSLTDFLLARYAEDEAAARAASPSPWSYPGIESVAGGTLYDATRRIVDIVYEQPEDHDGTIVRHLLVPEADANGAHIARHDPARVLADVESKRRIVEDYQGARMRVGLFGGDDARVVRAFMEALHGALAHLALPYADHEDYREEWKP